MAVTLSANYIAEIRKGQNQPNTVLLVELDSGNVKYGQHNGGFDDVQVIVGTVTSTQNKLDPKKGYSKRGNIKFTIVGRNNFKTLIQTEYLKNRRVTRYDGFVNPGFAFSDYAATFTGIITEWERKGDTLTVTVTDDLSDGTKKIPAENATKTQTLDYTNSGAGQNPVDIMQSILKTDIGIPASLVDDAQFDSEQANWLAGWLFSRVITEPKAANDYLNELQAETNSFIVHDGEKITYKVFAPPTPGTVVDTWTDDDDILENSLTCRSGYKDFFYNRIVVRYDYDESGSNNDDNYENVIIRTDTDSQGVAQWDEVKSKVINSKWIRSFSHAQPTNVTGVVIYHASINNGAGNGTLTFTFDGGGDHTLQWTAPSGSIGTAVKVTKDGKFQLFDADTTKYIRVVVTNGSLAGSNQSDADITITSISGSIFADSLSQKLLSRYRDPSSAVSFSVDMNKAISGTAYIKPTDVKDLTTDEAFEFGDATWIKERLMLTSVRLDVAAGTVSIEAIEMKQYRNYGFIAPTSQPDWDAATSAQQEYAYIGDAANNELGAGNDIGWSII